MMLKRRSGLLPRAGIAFIGLLMLGGGSVWGTTLYVDDDAPLEGDGLSWETAFRFLQDALATAEEGGIDEIHVGQGLYRPDQDEAGNVTPGDREATFELIGGVALMGSYAGFGAPDPDARDFDAYESVLDGDIGKEGSIADNSYRILDASYEIGETLIEGFTIAKANADGPGNESYHLGGGLFSMDGRPTVHHCAFVGNVAEAAGGAAFCFYGSAEFHDCEFTSNSAENSGAIELIDLDSATIFACSFHGNSATDEVGGAVAVFTPALTILGCDFEGNVVVGEGRSETTGGAVYIAEDAFVSVTACVFIENIAELGGAVFTSGIETSFSDCWFGGNHATKYGGAVVAVYDYTSPTFSNCTFVGNHADRSGGAVVIDTHGTASFEDCTFLNNSCVEFGGGLRYWIGGHMSLTRCLFRGNVAWEEEDSCGGGLYGIAGASLIDCAFEDNVCGDRGGGAFLWHDDITIEGCTWTGNSVGFNGGGGLFLHGDSVVEDCAFIANTAPRGAGFWYHKDDSLLVSRCTMAGNIASDSGGGMRIDDDGVARLVDCCFIGNVAANNGGAMMIDDTGTIASLSNTTMTMNEAEVYGGGIFADVGELFLANSVLWGNAASMPYDEWNQLYYEYGDVRLDYSCVEGWMGTYEGYGCIDADPLFVRTPAPGDDGVWGTHDDDYGDLHLQSGSPCIDAGANNALPPDTFDLDEDGDTAERIPLDLDGNPRFADDPATADTGCGEPVIVDMGAYEFPGDAWHPMRIGDIDGDGVVNTTDLLALLAAWGGYEDACILADLDFSGEVDTGDLLTLLANWG